MLDTNVLIDGIRDEHAAAWQIINKILNGGVELYTSRPLVREYNRILQREIVDPNYIARINDLLQIAIHIEIHNVQRLVPDDPEDDKVIATALASGAEVLISEDAHLLDLDRKYEIRIMKPKEYLNRNTKDSSWGDFARMIGIN